MRALILTCNTGGGHNACAKAIQEVFTENGHSCEVADAIGFVSEKLSRFFIDAVAGCEEYNLNYFVRLGGAVTADSPEDMARLCLELMRKKECLALMKDALNTLPRQNAAGRICEIICGGKKEGGS